MKLHRTTTVISTACFMLLLITMAGASEFSKTVIEEGDCSKGRAEKGDSLKVDYIVSFENGTKFESSYDMGEPFELVLGEGTVIQCWEKGIEGLCVGEKATLVCPPELAYGDSGSKDGIVPPNSTIIFDVEIVSIKKS